MTSAGSTERVRHNNRPRVVPGDFSLSRGHLFCIRGECRKKGKWLYASSS